MIGPGKSNGVWIRNEKKSDEDTREDIYGSRNNERQTPVRVEPEARMDPKIFPTEVLAPQTPIINPINTGPFWLIT